MRTTCGSAAGARRGAGRLAAAICIALPAIAFAFGNAATAGGPSDAGGIAALMMNTWNAPDAPLIVGPIVTSGAHAVAGWTQGDRGGRALLRRKDGHWAVVLCSGAPLKRAEVLWETGVPAADAGLLASRLTAAEATMGSFRVGLLDSFEGTVAMEEGHGHRK